VIKTTWISHWILLTSIAYRIGYSAVQQQQNQVKYYNIIIAYIRTYLHLRLHKVCVFTLQRTEIVHINKKQEKPNTPIYKQTTVRMLAIDYNYSRHE